MKSTSFPGKVDGVLRLSKTSGNQYENNVLGVPKMMKIHYKTFMDTFGPSRKKGAKTPYKTR